MQHLRHTFILAIIGILAACTQQAAPEPGPKKFEEHQTSELAQLMRDMHQDMLHVRDQIQDGQPLPEYTPRYTHITSAAMTQEHMRTDAFEAYAQQILQIEKEMYQAAPEQQRAHYQTLVQNCIACHQAIGCTGPITKIKKLEIQ
ncbi:MAG: hypothetical protein Q4F57_01610 [Weeksellaceae bacterium]|nr:hypothetical protein [Weeksellaceae bacterium]